LVAVLRPIDLQGVGFGAEGKGADVLGFVF
jgi:hypothetical protein